MLNHKQFNFLNASDKNISYLDVTAILSIFAFFLFRSYPVLTDNLFLDETISYWIASHSIKEIPYLSVTFQGSSPLYFLFLKAWLFMLPAANHAEILLRVPSVLFLLTQCYLLFLIGKTIRNPLLGLQLITSLLIYACFEPAFLYARPYALTSLFLIASHYAFLLFLKNNKTILLFILLLLNVLVVYGHVIASLALLPQLYFILCNKIYRPNFYVLIFLATISFVCLFPLTAQIILLVYKSDILDWVTPLRFSNFLFFLTTCVLLFTCIQIKKRPSFTNQQDSLENQFLLYLFFSYFCSLTILCVLSILGIAHLVVNRYVLFSGISLLTAIIIIISSYKHVVLVVTFVFCLTLLLSYQNRHAEWKEAVEYLNATQSPDEQLYAYTGLIESYSRDYLNNSKNKEYLLSPFSYYKLPMDPCPIAPDNTNSINLASYCHKPFTNHSKTGFLVSLWSNSKSGFNVMPSYFENWISKSNCEILAKINFEQITVYQFKCGSK